MVKISGINRKVNAETVAKLLIELDINPENIAVVKNGAIISRKKWDSEEVAESDEIEFFSPVGGG